MIFHPGRTGSCIMPPRRAVSCLLKLNPPARIGKKVPMGTLTLKAPSLKHVRHDVTKERARKTRGRWLQQL